MKSNGGMGIWGRKFYDETKLSRGWCKLKQVHQVSSHQQLTCQKFGSTTHTDQFMSCSASDRVFEKDARLLLKVQLESLLHFPPNGIREKILLY